jgi:outer membrane protein OmpA-like peptidoglycan-associated protein
LYVPQINPGRDDSVAACPLGIEGNTEETTMKKMTLTAFLAIGGIAWAQAPQSPPVYRIVVVARTTKAINYNHRSGPTMIGFQGTDLMPAAHGEARVESKQGVIKIDADMQDLGAANTLGPEYLTYVMWAVTPEGRATNIGEVLIDGGKSKLHATTELQSFGLIVTAEPYFAVTQPSDLVVMENFVRKDTTGTIEQMDAKYELLQRGQYVLNVNPGELGPRKFDRKVPLELYEARNAVQIARWTGAQLYAADTFLKATQGLENAEGYLHGKAGKKPIGTVAREAVQMAEDARIITVKKIDEEQLAAERQAGADREARAENGRAAAQSETERVTREAEGARLSAQTEADRAKRESDADITAARIEADRLRQANDVQAAVAQAEADRLKRDNEAKLVAARSEADRLGRVNDSQASVAANDAERLKRDNDAKMAAAQAEADRLRQLNDSQALIAAKEADSLKRDNDAKMAATQVEADRLRQENDAQRVAAQNELDRVGREKTELRAQLLLQFNAILQTRDTARGLIVNMSDVLFDTGKFSLRPEAREKLAKVAGIVAGHPGLTLAVEGHTDSVGRDDYNQQLSEQRGGSVRDYLIAQGMGGSSVSSKGFGKTQPVASNETAAGRQQNRRVELVISGDGIGTAIGIPIASR